MWMNLKLVTLSLWLVTTGGVSAQLVTNSTSTHSSLRQRNMVEISEKATQQRLLDNAKNFWYAKNSKYPSYRYNFLQDCDGCAGQGWPWRVQMNGGSPALAVDIETRKRSGALSIAQTFDRIQGAIDSDDYSVLATYDETFGFPNTYRIDYGSGNGGVVTSSIFGFQFELDGSPQDQLTKNRATWESQHVRDYDFTYFQEGPNPNNIQWPLSVKVRNGSPVETRDRNGNLVTYLIPMSFDQVFDMVQRQFDKPYAPFIDNDYSKRGYAREVMMVTDDVGTWKIHFCTFTDAVTPVT